MTQRRFSKRLDNWALLTWGHFIITLHQMVLLQAETARSPGAVPASVQPTGRLDEALDAAEWTSPGHRTRRPEPEPAKAAPGPSLAPGRRDGGRLEVVIQEVRSHGLVGAAKRRLLRGFVAWLREIGGAS